MSFKSLVQDMRGEIGSISRKGFRFGRSRSQLWQVTIEKKIQKVQKALLQSDVQSKCDKSRVTVADYGSQAVVSLLLQRELSSEPFSLVAGEVNKPLYLHNLL